MSLQTVVPDLAERPELLTGAYVEQPFHRHVEAREDLLRRADWLPEPEAIPRFTLGVDELHGAVEEVRGALRGAGIAKLGLERELSNEELIAFGGRLGRVMVHETSPRLRGHVEDDLVLNLRQEYDETPEYDLALVSRNYLTLHSEVCVKPLPKQPRLIALLCVEPSAPDTGGQTVFVPMTAVHDRLTPEQTAVLSETNFAEFPHSPPLLSWRDGRPVFSFRDFGTDVLYWRYVGTDERIDVATVNDAIKAVLRAMYDPELMFGVHWRRAELLVFDNWVFFHGRTFIREPAGARRSFKNLKLN